MERIATYTWHPGTDRWVWDLAMYRLHGYASDAITPTRPLFLALRHPGDRERMREALSAAAVHGRAFACRHRILTEDGTVRPAVALGGSGGAGRIGADGPLVRGFVVDTTPPLYHRPVGYEGPGGPEEPYSSVGAALARAVGVLRTGLDLTSEAASDLLKWIASTQEVPLPTVASRVLELPRASPAGSPGDVAFLVETLAASS